MSFDAKVVEWIEEIQNYLKDGSKKTSGIKNILRSADFDKLSYADRAKLYEMFDPKCEITNELFKRQLNLYFSLLEDKNGAIKFPIFSEYIDWIYSQDISQMSDSVFDVLTSRLLKTTATEISEPIMSFMDRLPEAFGKDIDKLSNQRISTLINILNELKMNYATMPAECKAFVTDMFKACAVKSEIADKNKTKMKRLFSAEPSLYYNFFNKAFSGTGAYEKWIDEPAKKITVPHMINYANFQDKVLANYRKSLTYDAFVTYAHELRLPKFPEYDRSVSNYSQFYLKEPREYKDYAKKMGDLFVQLVRDEMSRVEKLFDEKRIDASDLYTLALTNNAKAKVRLLNPYASKKEFLSKYAEFLIGLVHLDELTGQSYRDIYDVSHIKDTDSKVSVQPAPKPSVEARYDDRRYPQSRNSEVEGQYSLFGDMSPSYAYREPEKPEYEPLTDREFTVADLPELYERYNDLVSQGKPAYDLAEIIVGLEERRRDQQDPKYRGDDE